MIASGFHPGLLEPKVCNLDHTGQSDRETAQVQRMHVGNPGHAATATKRSGRGSDLVLAPEAVLIHLAAFLLLQDKKTNIIRISGIWGEAGSEP